MITDSNRANTKKVVLITGASSGIGKTTAFLLAKKDIQVVLDARRVDRLKAIASDIQAEGRSVVHRTLDVTSLEQMQAFVNFAQEKFGHIDAIVNNAGVIPLSKLEVLPLIASLFTNNTKSATSNRLIRPHSTRTFFQMPHQSALQPGLPQHHRLSRIRG
jgi:NADP-dependent 3-hydroxy acid dehydrogenase YdfG